MVVCIAVARHDGITRPIPDAYCLCQWGLEWAYASSCQISLRRLELYRGNSNLVFGGVLNIIAAVWTAGFHWWRSDNKKRTQNVSEYMLVLALCLVSAKHLYATYLA